MRITQILAATFCICGAASANAQSMDYSPGFTAGPPTEMAQLEFLVGQYDIDLYFPAQNSAGQMEWQAWAKTRATIAPILGGGVLQEATSHCHVSSLRHRPPSVVRSQLLCVHHVSCHARRQFLESIEENLQRWCRRLHGCSRVVDEVEQQRRIENSHPAQLLHRA